MSEKPDGDPPNGGMGGMGANQLAGNVIVGVGLGWLSQHFFPSIAPWGYACGVILGAVSGFWQVLKANGALGPTGPKGKRGRSDQL
jgi:F0F1-type ATP synthase assembly protein I